VKGRGRSASYALIEFKTEKAIAAAAKLVEDKKKADRSAIHEGEGDDDDEDLEEEEKEGKNENKLSKL
jgi:hypothetical protein